MSVRPLVGSLLLPGISQKSNYDPKNMATVEKRRGISRKILEKYMSKLPEDSTKTANHRLLCEQCIVSSSKNWMGGPCNHQWLDRYPSNRRVLKGGPMQLSISNH